MKFQITLKYKDKFYEVVDDSWTEKYGWGEEEEGVNYMWTEGNYSCDCNKSLFIKRQCNHKFKEMECGNKIELISIKKI